MPSGSRRAATRQVNYAPSPYKQSPTKVEFNDDYAEKQHRIQSHREQLLKDSQPGASPVRKMNNQRRRPRDSDVSLSGSEAATPTHTPKQSLAARAAARRSISGAYKVPLRGDGPSTPIAINAVNSTAITPLKRVPILANFEEWMKLATDNKINATNSWNFALIDYFHDMSLLREGDGVNFQKASCTLDGCVKIYTSRVDSVATETGRLLSGLADSAENDKKRRKGDEDEEEGEEGEDDGEEDGEEGAAKKKAKRKANRSHEATLAPSFASLQLKKLELEFAVDPLFKKASADFDEGGAKGLLLNHLSIDAEGRIVFDSSDDAVDDTATKSEETEQYEDATGTEDQHDKQQEEESPDQEIDLEALGCKFFSNLSILDEQDICPSMKNFKIGDPNAQLTIPFLQSGNDDWKKHKSPEKSQPPPQIPSDLQLADQSGLFLDGSNPMGFDDDDDDDNGIGGALEMGDDIGFGEGGEAWAREAAVEPQLKPHNAEDDNGGGVEEEEDYALSMSDRYRESAEQETMLAFFGKAFNSRAKVGTKAFNNLTNWRIQKIQKAAEAEAAPTTKSKKEKEPLQIDFHGPLSDNLKKLLAAEPANNSAISLPKTQLKTKGRNLLDKDDEVIDVKAMMRLWTKPKVRIGKRKAGGIAVIDEGFGARGREQPQIQEAQRDRFDEEEADDDGPQGDYDANFFADNDPLPFFDGPLPIDDDDDDEGGQQPGFVDAREMLSPPPDAEQLRQGLDAALDSAGQDPLNSQDMGLFPPSTQTELLPGSFGTQLVTQQGRRLRPEYVNFARVAKKVDVRALKENMWKGMSQNLSLDIFDDPNQQPPSLQRDNDGDTEMSDPDAPLTPKPQNEDQVVQRGDGAAEVLRFTDILGNLKSVYPETQMKDISTSYGFICLLHLANEKGLLLEGGREDGMMNEIMVRRDERVGPGYVGE